MMNADAIMPGRFAAQVFSGTGVTVRRRAGTVSSTSRPEISVQRGWQNEKQGAALDRA
jgi:hypothetical protein